MKIQFVKRILSLVSVASLIACVGFGTGLQGNAITARSAVQNTVEPDITGDSDMYHIMQLATGEGISDNLLEGVHVSEWGEGYTEVEATRHDGTNGMVYKLVNTDKELETGLVFGVDTALMKPGTYTFSGWGKSEKVEQKETPAGTYYSYSLLIIVSYKDNTSNNYSAEFTMGTYDWEFRDVSFTIDREVRDIQMYAFLRKPCVGIVWFDDFSLVRATEKGSTFHNTPVQVLRTSPNEATKATLKTKDGLELGLGNSTVTSLKVDNIEIANNAYSGFMVRDIAATNGVYAFEPTSKSAPAQFRGDQSTLGLNISADYTAKDNHIAVNGVIRENTASKDGRAVALYYALPVTASGWRWGEDIQTSYEIETGKPHNVYKKLGDYGLDSVTDWAGAAHSVYQTSTLYNDDLGIAIAVSIDFPTQQELEYNGSTHQYVLTYQLGIVKEAPDSAKFSFVIYKLDDPKWGFRAAFEKYTRIFPEHYIVREKEHGVWLGPQDVYYESIPDIEDFNIKFNEESRDKNVEYFRAQGSQEIERGIKGYQYIEPSGFWIPGAVADVSEPTTEKVNNVIKQLANSTNPSVKFQSYLSKVALNVGPMLDIKGELVWNPTNAAWASNGVFIGANFNPNLPGFNYWDMYFSDYLWDVLFDANKSIGFPFDGIYLDEMSGWPMAGNFNREHYKYTTVPLTYSPYYKKPVLLRSATNWEFVNKMSAKLHEEGKTVFANKGTEKHAFNSGFIDAHGVEWWGWENGKYYQCSLEQMSQYRTLAYQKPFCILLAADYSDGNFDSAQLERYMQYCLLFGFIPSPWNSTGDGGGLYWNTPGFYERDRAVWKKYSPVLKTVSEAGWEPVTYAATNNENVLIERFGKTAENGVYFSVHNTASTEQEVTVTIPTSLFAPTSKTLYKELISGEKYTLNNNTHKVTLKPYQTIVLTVADPQSQLNNKDDSVSSNESGNIYENDRYAQGNTVLQGNNITQTENPPAESILFKGQLLDAKGEAIVGAKVELLPIERSRITDENGGFTFNYLPYGEYSIRILGSDGAVEAERKIIFANGDKTALKDDTITVSGGGISIRLYVSDEGKITFGKLISINKDGTVDTSSNTFKPWWLFIILPLALVAAAGGVLVGRIISKRKLKA